MEVSGEGYRVSGKSKRPSAREDAQMVKGKKCSQSGGPTTHLGEVFRNIGSERKELTPNTRKEKGKKSDRFAQRK